MTVNQIQTFPDGLAAAPGLAMESEPTSGFFKKSGGVIGLSIAGVEVASYGANGEVGGMKVSSINFVESGTHTYTGTIALPAFARIIDIGCDGQALWNSAGACSLIVGDDVDPDGFFTATDLKATDLLAGEINNLEHPGGKAGAYILNEQRNLYSGTTRNVVAVVTVASGSGTLGRTRVYVAYAVGVAVTPVLT